MKSGQREDGFSRTVEPHSESPLRFTRAPRGCLHCASPGLRAPEAMGARVSRGPLQSCPHPAVKGQALVSPTTWAGSAAGYHQPSRLSLCRATADTGWRGQHGGLTETASTPASGWRSSRRPVAPPSPSPSPSPVLCSSPSGPREVRCPRPSCQCLLQILRM